MSVKILGLSENLIAQFTCTDAFDDFLLPKPKILKPLPPDGPVAAVVLPEDAATTSGLDPFLAAKSWKLIGGAEALRGLLE